MYIWKWLKHKTQSKGTLFLLVDDVMCQFDTNIPDCQMTDDDIHDHDNLESRELGLAQSLPHLTTLFHQGIMA